MTDQIISLKKVNYAGGNVSFLFFNGIRATHYFLNTVDSRYLDFDYLEQPPISKRKSGQCLDREI